MSTPTVTNLAPDVPWRMVSTVQDDGSAVTYTAHKKRWSASNSVKTLHRVIRHPDSNATAFQSPPGKDIKGLTVLLIVNPKAGKGSKHVQAAILSTVTRILSEAGLTPFIQYTAHKQHAQQYLSEAGYEGLKQYAAIAGVGGDGTFQELAMGVISACSNDSIQVNWELVPPLAVIPAGSGNAIAMSIGTITPTHAALNIVNSLRMGNAKPLALMQYRKRASEQREAVCIGGVQWGLPADVDQGTERLRWMGDARFDLGAIVQIIKRRAVKGKITVEVDQERHESTWKDIQMHKQTRDKHSNQYDSDWLRTDDNGNFVLEEAFMMVVAWNSALIGEGFKVTPYARPTELGVFDLIVVRGSISRKEMLKLLLKVSDGSFLRLTDAYVYFKAKRMIVESLNGRFLTIDGESVSVEPFVLEMAPEDGKLRILDSFSEDEPGNVREP
ncbi:Sphingoid long chain base kinase 4 [Gracilariopsis chorda]|uniref:Sphingoid long chain base kinase 4 n=1 Tax=Gracilariopsis chorda TaxID=448386 RepID=A0A2V3IZR4_9FLOR|nr:Sphingoid long chain base kinase 4 [Gracilariopsis chorda]|eukprot:PXF47543.1 Sphingoid long chain base kinase 4 [Gracilariopsis chorda]